MRSLTPASGHNEMLDVFPECDNAFAERSACTTHMGKFTIQPHGRLQEWIAHEKDYFRDEGLDYEFARGPSSDTRKNVDARGMVTELLSGAFESYKHAGGNKGVKSDISCACHWAVNQASAEKVGTMWGKSYVVTPGGIMVPPESPIDKPDQLAGQEIAVGYHSGSHFTTIQSLEPFVPRDQIKLKFGGSIWARVDIGVGRDLPAVSVWGLSFQVLEQLGFRKIVDASFMIAFMFPAGVDPADIQKYMNGMRRAQMDLDLEPEKYRHFYLNEIPDRYKSMVDVRRFSPGERIVFLPYTEAMYAKTQAWIQERGLFEGQAPAVDYAACVAA
jgi:NitT/TauT family transport system substrate-binding protein